MEAALGYLDREVGCSRRGRNGVERVRAAGLVAAAFRHRTSRAGDPHLHTHVLVANLVKGSDGRWATLDSKPMWYVAKTAGFLYEAHLRAALTDLLGVEWGRVVNDIADIEGFDKPLRDHFSQRRKEIDAHMAERGTTSPRGAEVAALATRKAKDYAVDAHVLWASWCFSIGSSVGTAQGSLDHSRGRVRTGTVVSLMMTLTASSSGTSAVRPIVNRALVS